MMNTTEGKSRMAFSHLIIRVIVSMIVLAITAFLTPGFEISSFISLFFAAVVLSLIDWVITSLTGINATPFGRGILGFILAAAIIYVTKFFVAGYDITIWSALIGALVYGIVDAFIPGRAM